MQPNWAEENLQVIRTLMERAGLYRRALAPVMLSVGCVGVISGSLFHLRNGLGFAFHHRWAAIAGIGVAVAVAISRKQALRADESLLTPPARKVAGALFLPWFTAGLMTVALLPAPLSQDPPDGVSWALVSIWLVLYGCGLHAAAPFLVRGIARLAWGCALAGLAVFVGMLSEARFLIVYSPDLVMAATFGAFHLFAGIYLYFTEKRDSTP